ncbi:MAG: glycosyltransferase [Acidimicrobiales bacterium]
MTASVLSYWRDWFDPGGRAWGENHSTGLIAANLHRLLARRGPVSYLDHAERPRGLEADLFVGHFWAFAPMVRANRFRRSAAVYVLSDPTTARRELAEAAAAAGVPMPDWDLPPAEFDHEATLALADAVLLCGNAATRASFPARWRRKVHLFNYSLDPARWSPPAGRPAPRPTEFVYAASTCGLRKGFLDLIATWRGIPPERARCHVVGRLDPPYDKLLAEADAPSVVVHGWVDSASPQYRDLLRSCAFAYVPTWVEGQMGTLLETIFAGCIPITTAACGVDDEVLRHCVLVEPRRPDQHRAAIAAVLRWTPAERRRRQEALWAAARRRHDWAVFDAQVDSVLDEVLAAAASGSRRVGDDG